MFDHTQYVPILKWRQGEYQALLRTTAETKNGITPLVEIPPIEWDFEKGKLAKTIEDHIKPFAKRVEAKWGKAPLFVDAALLGDPKFMGDGTHVITQVFSDLRDYEVQAVPVTRLTDSAETYEANKRVIHTDDRGFALRVTLEEFADSLDNKIQDHIGALVQDDISNLDLIVDLGSPKFQPISDFANLLLSLISSVVAVDEVRSFTLAGTSFPETMAELSGPVTVLSREEWLLYKTLIGSAPDGTRLPAFGDYAIASPDIPTGDMRLLKPSASVRYTIDDAWRISKGQNVRDYGFEQYKDICAELSSNSAFEGDALSWGDAYIQKCGAGTMSTGNLTTWRGVGTNHHIAKVANDLASFHAP